MVTVRRHLNAPSITVSLMANSFLENPSRNRKELQIVQGCKDLEIVALPECSHSVLG